MARLKGLVNVDSAFADSGVAGLYVGHDWLQVLGLSSETFYAIGHFWGSLEHSVGYAVRRGEGQCDGRQHCREDREAMHLRLLDVESAASEMSMVEVVELDIMAHSIENAAIRYRAPCLLSVELNMRIRPSSVKQPCQHLLLERRCSECTDWLYCRIR